MNETTIMLANTLCLKITDTAAGIFVKSSKGSWLIRPLKSEKEIRLYHYNLDGHSSRKKPFMDNYHLQKDLPSVEEALKYINQHDRVRFTKYEKTERIFMLRNA